MYDGLFSNTLRGAFSARERTAINPHAGWLLEGKPSAALATPADQPRSSLAELRVGWGPGLGGRIVRDQGDRRCCTVSSPYLARGPNGHTVASPAPGPDGGTRAQCGGAARALAVLAA
jgi:hypothetical protein